MIKDAPRVTRGRFTNFRTGEFVEFLYNPETVEKNVGNNLIVDNIPGQSDPLIRWGSGKQRDISFTLKLCGESSLRLRGVNLLNPAVADELPLSEADETYSIAGEIEFFEQFTYPTDPEEVSGPGGGAPDLVIFTMGRAFVRVPCQLDSLGIKITEFTHELAPKRAELQFKLIRYETENVYASRVFKGVQS